MSDEKTVHFRVEADARDAATSAADFARQLTRAKDELAAIEKKLAAINKVSVDNLSDVGLRQRRLRQFSQGSPDAQAMLAAQRAQINEARSSGARGAIQLQREMAKALEDQLTLLKRGQQAYRDLRKEASDYALAARNLQRNPNDPAAMRVYRGSEQRVAAAAQQFPEGMRASMIAGAVGQQRIASEREAVKRYLDAYGAFSPGLAGLRGKERNTKLAALMTELERTQVAVNAERAASEAAAKLKKEQEKTAKETLRAAERLKRATETEARQAEARTQRRAESNPARVGRDQAAIDRSYARSQDRDFRRVVAPALSLEADRAARQRIVDEQIQRAQQHATRTGLRFDDTNYRRLYDEYELNRAVGEQRRAQTRTAADQRYEETRGQRARRANDATYDRLNDRGGAPLFMTQATLLRNYAIQGAALGGGAYLGNFTIQLEKELAQLQAISNATTGEMAKLEETIGKVASGSNYAAQEIVQASTAMAQAGLSARDIDKALPNVLKLATATGTDLATTVDVVTSTLSVFKLQTSEAAQVTDVLTNAMNRSKLDVSKYATGLQYAGNIAADSGLSYIELTSALAGMANQGIRTGSTLGTGLRQLLTDLQNPTDKAREHFEQMGLSMAELDVRSNGLFGVLRNMQRAGFTTADAMQTLEVRSAAAYTALVNNLPAVEALRGTLGGTGAASKAAAVQMDTLIARWTAFSNTVGLIFMDLVEPLVEAMKDFLAVMTEVLKVVKAVAPAVSLFVPPLLMLGTAKFIKDLGLIAVNLADITGWGRQASAAMTGFGNSLGGLGGGIGGGGGPRGPRGPISGLRGRLDDVVVGTTGGLSFEEQARRRAAGTDWYSRFRADYLGQLSAQRQMQSSIMAPLAPGRTFETILPPNPRAQTPAQARMAAEIERRSREMLGSPIRGTIAYDAPIGPIDRRRVVAERLLQLDNEMFATKLRQKELDREYMQLTARRAEIMRRNTKELEARWGTPFTSWTKEQGEEAQRRGQLLIDRETNGNTVISERKETTRHRQGLMAEQGLLQREARELAAGTAVLDVNKVALQANNIERRAQTIAVVSNIDAVVRETAASQAANAAHQNMAQRIPLTTRAQIAMNAALAATQASLSGMIAPATSFANRLSSGVSAAATTAGAALAGMGRAATGGMAAMAAAFATNPFTSFMIAIGVVVSAMQVFDWIHVSAAEKVDKLDTKMAELQGQMDSTGQSVDAVADQLRIVGQRSVDLSGDTGNLSDENAKLQDIVDETRMRFLGLGLQLQDNVTDIGQVRDALLLLQEDLAKTQLMQAQVVNATSREQQSLAEKNFRESYGLARGEYHNGLGRAASLFDRGVYDRAARGSLQLSSLSGGDAGILRSIQQAALGNMSPQERMTLFSRTGGAALGLQDRLTQGLSSGGIPQSERGAIRQILAELKRYNEIESQVRPATGRYSDAVTRNMQNMPAIARGLVSADPTHFTMATQVDEELRRLRKRVAEIQGSGLSLDQQRAQYLELQQDPVARQRLRNLRLGAEGIRGEVQRNLEGQQVPKKTAEATANTAVAASDLGRRIAELGQILEHSVFSGNEEALRNTVAGSQRTVRLGTSERTRLLRQLRGENPGTLNDRLAEGNAIIDRQAAAALMEYDAQNNIPMVRPESFEGSALGLGRADLIADYEEQRETLREQITQAFTSDRGGRSSSDAKKKYLELLVSEQKEVLDTATSSIGRVDDLDQIKKLRQDFEDNFADYRESRVDLFNRTWDNTQWSNPAEAADAKSRALASLNRKMDEEFQQGVERFGDRYSDIIVAAVDRSLKRVDEALKEADRAMADRLRPFQRGVTLTQGLANRGRIGETRQQAATDRLEYERIQALPDQIAAYGIQQSLLRAQETGLRAQSAAATNPTDRVKFEQQINEIVAKRKELEQQIADLRLDYETNTETTKSPALFSRETFSLMQEATSQWARASGAMQSAADSAAQGIKNAWDSLATGLKATVKDLLTGAATVEETFRNMLGNIIDALLNAAIEAMVNQAIMWFVQLFTGGGKVPKLPGAPVKPIRRAGGGEIRGGTPNRDSVPVLAEPGEFMIRKSAADMIGRDTLRQMNATGRAAQTGATNVIAMQKRDPDMVNVYLIPPDERPPTTDKDIILALERDAMRGGSTKRLIKAIAVGAV